MDEKQAEVDSANQAVTDKINEQPDVDLEDRSLVDQEEIRQLQAQAERAREQLVSAQDALDQAKTQTDQAQAIVNQRLQVLDQPELPPASRAGLRDAALTLIIFAVLGTILSVVTRGRVGDARSHDPRPRRHHRQVRGRCPRRRPRDIALGVADGQATLLHVEEEADDSSS